MLRTNVRLDSGEERGADGGCFELVGQVSVLLKQNVTHAVIRDAFVFVAAGSVRRLAHIRISTLAAGCACVTSANLLLRMQLCCVNCDESRHRHAALAATCACVQRIGPESFSRDLND